MLSLTQGAQRREFWQQAAGGFGDAIADGIQAPGRHLVGKSPQLSVIEL